MFSEKYFLNLDKFKNEPYNCSINTKKDLFMLNYKNINPDVKSELTKLNGIIIDSSNEKVVYYGLNKMNKNLQDFLDDNNNFEVEELIDGPKIGLYYYNDKWNKCTNKKIYASESIWHGPNFDILASKCFENFDFSKLNTDYCYTFVIQNPDCLNFVKYNLYGTVLISVRDLNPDSSNYLKEVKLEDNLFITPNKLDFDKETIKKNLESKDIKQLPGYIIKTNNLNYRLEHVNYLECINIKGNHRNMKFRYLEIRNDFEKKNIFLIYYPELINMVNNIEYQIKYLAGNILDCYSKRHIKKNNNFEINPRYKNIIYLIHGKYLETKEKITYDKILDILNNSDTKRLMYLLNTLFNKN